MCRRKESEIHRPISLFNCARTSCAKPRRREGVIFCASNLSAQRAGKLWQFYIQLTQVEAAFKDLKNDLSLRPIFLTPWSGD